MCGFIICMLKKLCFHKFIIESCVIRDSGIGYKAKALSKCKKCGKYKSEFFDDVKFIGE